MAKVRHLTKSRFKIGAECATKLYYNDRKEYGNKKSDDEFLKALAEGGYQVGELAKLYHPGGHDIETLDKDEALRQTNELLKLDNVTIFEAAVQFENLFIRIDVLEKKGREVNLIEVKAKSVDSTQGLEVFDKKLLKKSQYVLNAKWGSYVLDLAFQTYVVQKAFPAWSVVPHLMLADKSKRASVDGLHQLFLITRGEDGRVCTTVKAGAKNLGEPLLAKIPLVGEVSHVLHDVKHEGAASFDELVGKLSALVAEGQRARADVSGTCKGCEFRIDPAKFPAGTKSGFQECWKEAKGLQDADFVRELIFDVWDFRTSDKALAAGHIFAADLDEDDVGHKERSDDKAGWSRTDRQLIQIRMGGGAEALEFDTAGLAAEIEDYEYPLHFIDFETAMMAIPFHKGRAPYEQMAYQFSHHVLHADGRLEHRTQYLDTNVGEFPNFNFVRALKKALEGDNGTVFRFAAHENTVLNQIRGQLLKSSENDGAELVEWIESLTTPPSDSDEEWEPKRRFVDMRDLTLRYYYLRDTKGSNSIKKVLPAVLNHAGVELSAKFPEWIKLDGKGGAADPYKLLPPIFSDVDPVELEKIEQFLVERDDLNDGGAAMLAWARMQFTEMSEIERKALGDALLRYCGLDTLAMVMIWEWWQLEISRAGERQRVG